MHISKLFKYVFASTVILITGILLINGNTAETEARTTTGSQNQIILTHIDVDQMVQQAITLHQIPVNAKFVSGVAVVTELFHPNLKSSNDYGICFSSSITNLKSGENYLDISKQIGSILDGSGPQTLIPMVNSTLPVILTSTDKTLNPALSDSLGFSVTKSYPIKAKGSAVVPENKHYRVIPYEIFAPISYNVTKSSCFSNQNKTTSDTASKPVGVYFAVFDLTL